MSTPSHTCSLCDRGFPLNGYMHYGTQALGMIPETRCHARPPLHALPWDLLDGRASLVHIEGPDGEHVCSIPKARRDCALKIVRAANSHEALVAALQLSRRNVTSMINALAPDTPYAERKRLDAWLGEINGALGRANVW